MAVNTPTIAAPMQSVQPETSVSRLAAVLLVLQFVAFMVAFVVLSGAINWPASLTEPASVVLPLITEQRTAVAFGYSSYLLHALLLVPLALLLRRTLTGTAPMLITVGAAMGVLAGVMKMLGIIRWLVLMPALAAAYLEPSASQATRDSITVIYDAFNRYAGGVGENLGVALFSSLWTVLVGVAILRGQQLPAWLGWFALLAGALVLVPFAEVYGVDSGPFLIVSGVVWQLWTVVTAVVLFRLRPTRS